MTNCTKVISTVLIAGGLAGICLPGCGSKQANTGVGTQSPRILVAPTDEECRRFAAAVEEAVQSRDVAAFNAAIDGDALLESVIEGVATTEEERNGFLAAGRQRFSASGGFGRQLIQQVAEGGSYSFIRVHSEGRQKRILFRILSAEGGVNYHDMIVSRQPDGQVKAVDIFNYLSAETFSKMMRRGFIALTAGESSGVLDRLTGKESDLAKNNDKHNQMIDAMKQGQYRQVLDTYGRLPSSLQKEKYFLLLRIKAAIEVGDEEYSATIKDFRTWHPKDPCLDLICFDQLLIEERYDDALDSVDRLDAAVGPDPYLDVMRANVKTEQNQFAAAKQLAAKAIEADGTLVDAYWALLAVSLAEKDFDETGRLLEAMEEKFLLEVGQVQYMPEFAEYVKSPQYRKWLTSREQK